MQARPNEDDPRMKGCDHVRIALDALRRIVRALRTGSYHAEQKLSISGAQLFVLQVVAEQPGLSLRELARRTHTHPSSVSIVVARLCERGLLLRRVAADDARRAVLTVSASGRALLARAPQSPNARIAAAFSALTGRERRLLAIALPRLAAEMGADEETPEMFFEQDRPKRDPRGARPIDGKSPRASK